jgi:hypothetical protein
VADRILIMSDGVLESKECLFVEKESGVERVSSECVVETEELSCLTRCLF